jgi:hypothetical protein
MLGKIAIVVLAVFSFAKPSFATPPIILSFPQNIMVDSEFIITATMSGLTKNAAYRLRIAISMPDSHVYFGSTEGYSGMPSPIDYSKFKSITTDNSGSWNGEIKGKVDNSDQNYKDKDQKTFEMKLGRYTENGTNATWSEAVKVNLENPNPLLPTEAPLKAVVKMGTPKPTPQKTEISVQKTQTPTPSSPPIISISQIIEEEIDESDNILATSSSKIIETPRASDSPRQNQESKAKYFFFISSFFFFLLSLIAFLKKKADIIK